MKPRRPIPRQSKKRTTEARQYAKAKKVFLWQHHICAGCNNPVALERRELHHWASRAGKLFLEKRLWLCLCHDCHRWVHDHPHAAKMRGLLAPNGCWNDYGRAMKAYEASEWRLYIEELDGVE